MPSACLAPERLWRLPFDHHRITVEVVLDFPPSFSQRRSAAASLSSLCEFVKVSGSMITTNDRLSARYPDEVVVRRISRRRSAAAEHPAPACGPQRETS